MNNPRMTGATPKMTAPPLDLNKVYGAMAHDLQIAHDPEVTTARSLLQNGKYLSFVHKLDSWTQQMYGSIGDLGHRRWILAALFSKYPFNDESLDRDKTAWAKFAKSEHKCRRMNQKFRARRLRAEPPHMNFMRNWISEVLGDEPNMDQIFSKCDFGPGSSVSVHGTDVSILNKLDSLTVTPALTPVALAALNSNYQYRQYIVDRYATRNGYETLPGPDEYGAQNIGLPTFNGYVDHDMVEHVQHNSITFVPKNAKTNRTIAIEPTLNGFVQKGIDLLMRAKLYRIGVDLSSQALNQALAQLGSRGRGYATIDLSAASDSICIELARELLPLGWFTLLNCARSPMYSLQGGVPVRYEKFCSMGNGFCFPLETLIFRAAVEYAMSVVDVSHLKTVAVYGDDIIVPQECALVLLETLRDIGFVHNTDKTFVFGPFRESCGADWFEGVSVRPTFVKEQIKANYECYPLLNSLMRANCKGAWQAVHDQLPSKWRLYRPYEREDDSAINVPLDVFMTSKYAKWDRDTFSWTWKAAVRSPSDGREAQDDSEIAIGVMRGNFRSTSDQIAKVMRDEDGVPCTPLYQNDPPRRFTARNSAKVRTVRTR